MRASKAFAILSSHLLMNGYVLNRDTIGKATRHEELLLKKNLARVMGFDPIKEEVTQWLN
ncbi:MAG: hypothetical protein QNK37_13625 [Acidobacteriota bacterium]|nr:hypothetical protein [Acidobacteriota bacterium]